MKELIDKIVAILISIFAILYVIAFVKNSIDITLDIIDVIENGPVPLREGYIPVKQRKYPDVKVLPPGADPKDYIKEGED